MLASYPGRLTGHRVAVLAGRRIDAVGETKPCFPLNNVAAVRADVAKLLAKEQIQILICSAACGADLIALQVARRQRVSCRVILPFNRMAFRQSSVVDRPGDWGHLYDSIISKVDRHGGLVELDGVPGNHEAYASANQKIVRTGLDLCRPEEAVAVIVWDGLKRSDRDLTDEFRQLCVAAKFNMRTIITNNIMDEL